MMKNKMDFNDLLDQFEQLQNMGPLKGILSKLPGLGNKLDDIGCKGAPDIVIEVLSPSTARNDRIVKYRLYERAGVPEYWIVNPETKIVTVHLLEDGRYHSPLAYTEQALVPVSIWEGFNIDLSLVFPKE